VSAAGRAAQARAGAGPRLGGPPDGAAGAGRRRAAARAGQAGRRADGGATGPACGLRQAPRPACVLQAALRGLERLGKFFHVLFQPWILPYVT